MTSRRNWAKSASLAVLFAAPMLAVDARAATLPFVGCPSDGQLGPVAAPKGKARPVAAVGAKEAGGLAVYVAKNSTAVVAPRGWKCFFAYGSDGTTLIVAPSSDLAKSNDNLTGPALVYSFYFGGASGRFEVAKYAARLFPQEQTFVAGVVAEGIEPKSDFPPAPYPDDRLTRRNASLIEFQTPAGKEGLGVSDRLKASALPVEGFVRLTGAAQEPSITLVTMRLPANLAVLSKTLLAADEAAK